MSVQFEKRVFNVDEYHRMSEAGILSEDDRVELVDGEILNISPIGSRHVGCVNRLNGLLNQRIAQLALVSIQNPIRIDDYSEPEPDVALLKPRADYYAQSLATVDDVLLIIEVADTSLEYDRSVKLSLYARAGIVEVWLVNLSNDTVEACSQPANGIYQTVRIVKRGETILAEGFPTLVLSAEEILG
jgi:Uma2 family endonuclease